MKRKHSSSMKLSNSKSIRILILVLFGIVMITFIIPFLLSNYFPQSLFGRYMITNLNIMFVSLLVLLYFSVTGIYVYDIYIDQYVIHIKSKHIVTSLFGRYKHLDISHDMLVDYNFFKRPLTINTILMIKIKNSKGKVMAKRFPISYLTEKEKSHISRIFEKINSENK